MDERRDLLIIGGGLVGASLLLALKNLNLKIALIEAKQLEERTEPVLDQRSLVLSLGTKLFFESLGVWDKISQYTTPINTIKVSEQGKFNKVFLDKRSFDVPALGYVINIQLLNKAIWNSLDSSKVDIYCPWLVKDLEFDNNSASIKIEKNNL